MMASGHVRAVSWGVSAVGALLRAAVPALACATAWATAREGASGNAAKGDLQPHRLSAGELNSSTFNPKENHEPWNHLTDRFDPDADRRPANLAA
jgi:hypothetical protein